jgi:DNA invertase Pin-like site-specific DNA recombinase
MPAKNEAAVTAPPVAYSYLRFSSRGQADGDTIRRQTVRPEEWCKRNGVVLDTSLRFEDRGRSAFRRHHTDRESLSEFRRLVAEGRIRPGSYLIVENLDRLSREEERIAVELLLSIVNSGITVVQLMPEEQTFGPKNLDMLGLMRAVIQMAQAHQESAKKADRLGEVWEQKRKAAIAGTGTLTRTVPGWIDSVDGKFKLNAERAAVVRRLFKLCIAGYGGQATARLLNKEGVPTMKGRGKWHQSAVTYILRSRATLGEWQPHTQHDKDARVPVGEVIKDYYPAVVGEDTWNAAQGAMNGRVTLAGRPPRNRTNIFRGLLRDARRGGRLGLSTSTWKKENGDVGGQHAVYTNCDRTAGESQYSFPAELFQAAILSRLREIDPREVVGESAAAERVLTLEGQRKEIVATLNRTAEALGGADSPTVVAKIQKWEAELRKLDDQLATARQEAANPLANAWSELPGLVELAATEEGRVRLAAVLRRVVDSIWCLFTARGRTRIALAQVRFVGSDQTRDYIVIHEPASTAGSGRARKLVEARSAVGDLESEQLTQRADLRDREDARRAEAALNSEEVVAALWDTLRALDWSPKPIGRGAAGDPPTAEGAAAPTKAPKAKKSKRTK